MTRQRTQRRRKGRRERVAPYVSDYPRNNPKFFSSVVLSFCHVWGALPMQFKSICGSISATIAILSLIQATPAGAQLIPEPWVTVGSKDSAVTYGVGVKFFDLGAEVATGPKGVTGVDALKFFSFPVISPYAGLGIYGDKGIAYSGGVQFYPPGNTFYGVGYHSIRGINGQLGFKF